MVIDRNPASFRLTPGIYDRAASATDVIVEPVPGFLINRFTHRTQNFQGAQIIALNIFQIMRHQCANSSGSCVEMSDTVFLDDFPESARIGRSEERRGGKETVARSGAA